MFGRVLSAVIVLAVAGALLVLGWPQLFGLEQAGLIAKAVAFRGACAAIGLVLLVLALLVMAAIRSSRRLLSPIAVLLLAFVVFQVVAVGSRGLVATALPEPKDGTVTVLAWNTKGDAVAATELAGLVEETKAEVVSLPETTGAYARQVRALLQADGAKWQVFTEAYDTISPARSTSLLISDRLGRYTVNNTKPTTGRLPTVVAIPADGEGPTILAVHAVSPTDPSTWRSDLRWLAKECKAGEDLILAGDFNSTLDHWSHLIDTSVPDARLGACLDSASAAGQGGQGTWPTNLPSLLGAPIDHVLHSTGWTVTGFRVIGTRDASGSDHRPVLARLQPAP